MAKRRRQVRLSVAELEQREAEVAAYIVQQQAEQIVWRMDEWPLVGDLRWRRVVAIQPLRNGVARVTYEECVGLR